MKRNSKLHLFMFVIFSLVLIVAACDSSDVPVPPAPTPNQGADNSSPAPAPTPAAEVEYNYISPAELKDRLAANDLENGNIVLISSQTYEEYRDSFIPGTIATFSRPLETAEDYAKLEPTLETVKNSNADVIIICPRGGSGATRPFDYYVENGIEPTRLLILEGGQDAFHKDFPDYTARPYISPADFAARIDAGELDNGGMILVDTQTEIEYAVSHFPEAYATFARPLETPEEFTRLDMALEEIWATDADVIIICPRGGSGATRPFDYYASAQIDPERLLMLEGGQEEFFKQFPKHPRLIIGQ